MNASELKTNNRSTNQETKPALKDLCKQIYRKAFIICLFLSAFQQLTGINGVIFDSNEIFTHGKNGLSADKAARIGTFSIGKMVYS